MTRVEFSILFTLLRTFGTQANLCSGFRISCMCSLSHLPSLGSSGYKMGTLLTLRISWGDFGKSVTDHGSEKKDCFDQHISITQSKKFCGGIFTPAFTVT